MILNRFPTYKKLESIRKLRKVGFTNGKTIFINLYSKALSEEFIESDLNIVYIHELIHTIDMDIDEPEVVWITKIIYKNLR